MGTLPEIMGGYLMSGGADYLLHAFVRSLEHYRELLARLTKLDGIAHIQSSSCRKLSRTGPLRSRSFEWKGPSIPTQR